MPEAWTASSAWLIDLLDAHAAEIHERNLVVHRELDPDFQLRPEPRLEAAFKELLRFVFETLPNDCELYLASARTIAAVTRLDSGTLTLRWQVLGDLRAPGEGGTTSIRPIAGGASFHQRSARARSVEEAFRRAGWTIEFNTNDRDTELWVHAATR